MSHIIHLGEEDAGETVSMLITPDDVAVFFNMCSDVSLSTRKQVPYIMLCYTIPYNAEDECFVLVIFIPLVLNVSCLLFLLISMLRVHFPSHVTAMP